jgi:hypothetical protein
MPNDLTADLQASLPGRADAVQDYSRAAVATRLIKGAVDDLLEAERMLAVTSGAGHTGAAAQEALSHARVAHERAKQLLTRLARRT